MADPLSRRIGDQQAPGGLWSPTVVAIIIAAYITVHSVTRLLMGTVLGIDDAEQALFAQHLNWGYRFEQPPLFTWIYVILGNWIGFGVIPATIMRYSLLALCAMFLYLTARDLISDRRLAALAVYSFGLVYVFAVYSHHDLTHTTILATVIAATMWTVCRLVRTPDWGWYAALGLCIGLGTLSKWNYVMLPVAIALAALIIPQTRGLILSPRVLLTFAVTALVLVGPMSWIHDNLDSVDAVRQSVLANGGSPPTFLSVLTTGTINLFIAFLAFPQPLLVIFAAVFGPGLIARYRNSAAGPGVAGGASSEPGKISGINQRLLSYTILIGIALHWLLVPVLGATSFNERWMHTVLMPAPLVAFALLDRFPPTRRALRIFIGILVAVTALAWAGLVTRHLLGADACGSCRTLTPIPELAAEISDETGFHTGTIVTSGFHLGGNLRIAFPGAIIIDISYPAPVWPEPVQNGSSRHCLAVWTTAPAASRTPPPVPGDVAARLAVDFQVEPGHMVRQGYVDALMAGSETRLYALGYALYENEGTRC